MNPVSAMKIKNPLPTRKRVLINRWLYCQAGQAGLQDAQLVQDRSAKGEKQSNCTDTETTQHHDDHDNDDPGVGPFRNWMRRAGWLWHGRLMDRIADEGDGNPKRQQSGYHQAKAQSQAELHVPKHQSGGCQAVAA